MSKFVIKKRPTKPTRGSVDDEMCVNVYDGMNLKSMLEYIPDGYDTSDLYFRVDDYGNGTSLDYHRIESDEEYQARLTKYLKKSKNYKQWLKDNKAEIEAELERRKNKVDKRQQILDEIERSKEKLRQL